MRRSSDFCPAYSVAAPHLPVRIPPHRRRQVVQEPADRQADLGGQLGFQAAERERVQQARGPQLAVRPASACSGSPRTCPAGTACRPGRGSAPRRMPRRRRPRLRPTSRTRRQQPGTPLLPAAPAPPAPAAPPVMAARISAAAAAPPLTIAARISAPAAAPPPMSDHAAGQPLRRRADDLDADVDHAELVQQQQRPGRLDQRLGDRRGQFRDHSKNLLMMFSSSYGAGGQAGGERRRGPRRRS